ncbi:MAG: alpha-galactosidase [Cytophagales bacterium]|nr:alpha-galactosidase [Armatimonadota bacterium]
MPDQQEVFAPAKWAYGECAAFLDTEGILTLRNTWIERKWRVDRAGSLYPVSLRDLRRGVEWLTEGPEIPSPTPSERLPDEPREVHLTSETGRARITEAPSLTVTLTAKGEAAAIAYRFQIFEGASGIVIQLLAPASRGSFSTQGNSDSSDGGNTSTATPTGIETADRAAALPVEPTADTLESLALAPPHLRLTQVTLLDRTDEHNELAFEREWLLHPAEKSLALTGGLFFAEDPLTRAGIVFLKFAPLPHAEPERRSPHDLMVQPRARRFKLLGQGAGDEGGAGYAWATLLYSDGVAGRVAALQALQQQMRPFEPGRDGLLVTNTWGDRGQDGRVSTEFLSREIKVGQRLGVDVIQIDDGWQKGRTANSVQAGGVWEGFYAAEPDFWTPHPGRFFGGLSPLVETARDAGLRFGLWFAPDSSEDFAHWKDDAQTLLRLHQELGVSYFKIDGVKLRSKAGERNLRAFFDEVLVGSEGRVVFDTDVTAETRHGYFGLPDTGPLFVENRYTDWHRYWPHQTLRNVWKLAHYLPPVRLRMEFLNHQRNQEKYKGDPLAPATYRADYLFATVMLTSPLGWFELQNLPPTYIKEAAPLVAVWKRHRAELYGGTTLPIGEAPDGTAWTGFATSSPDARTIYALLFREHNDRTGWSTLLPALDQAGKWKVEMLSGDGSVTVLPRGRLAVTIPQPQRFVFARVTLDPE